MWYTADRTILAIGCVYRKGAFMRRLLLLVLTLSLLLPLPAMGEEGGFDLSILEAREDIYSFQDNGMVDTVYRFSDQPFFCQVEGSEVETVAFLDFESLALEGCVVPRLSLSTTSFDPLYADTLLLTVGNTCWRLSVNGAFSEYDGVYYEDFGFCFSTDSLALLEAMARSREESFAFTLLSGEEELLSGQMPLPAEAAGKVYDLFQECGGEDQPLEAVAERWPFEKEK